MRAFFLLLMLIGIVGLSVSARRSLRPMSVLADGIVADHATTWRSTNTIGNIPATFAHRLCPLTSCATRTDATAPFEKSLN